MSEHSLEGVNDGRSGSGDAPGTTRRRLLVGATSALGAAGLVTASAPFIASMSPSARVRAESAPVEADISSAEPGQRLITAWRRRPVWILHRTRAMLKVLTDPAHEARLADPRSRVTSQQPAYAGGELRSIKPQYIVVIPVCTHLGCIPTFRPEIAPADLGPAWDGGLFCPCHGSKFDFSGRVYRGVPAPTNLLIPPYHYLNDNVIRIGEDPNYGST